MKQELNDLRVRKDAITSGKRAPEFIQTALYEASMALHAHNRGYVFHKWAEKQTNKKFEDITEAEIKQLRETYKAYRDTEMKNEITLKSYFELLENNKNIMKILNLHKYHDIIFLHFVG